MTGSSARGKLSVSLRKWVMRWVRMFRIASVSLWLLVAAAAPACSDTTLEARDAKVVQGGPSCERFLGAQGDARFYRMELDLEYGTKPPRTLENEQGITSTKAYVERTVATQGVDGQPVGWTAGWTVITVVLLVLGLFLMAHTLVRKLYDSREEPRHTGARFWGPIIAGFALMFFAGLTGLWAGSPVVIENASPETVQVYVNGKPYTRLKPVQFVRTRIGGHVWHVEVRKDGQLVERITAKPDRDLWDTVKRAYLGNGAFLYNICGLNRLTLDKAVYGPE